MKDERKTAKKLKIKPRKKTKFNHSARIGGKHTYEVVDVEEWNIEEWLRVYNETWFGEENLKKHKGRMVIV